MIANMSQTPAGKPVVMWVAVLLTEAAPQADKHFEYLPGLFGTSGEALDAAEAAMRERSDVLMIYACREVH